MARPRKRLPPNGLEIIREAASHGLSEVKLARALGMGWDAWKRIRDEDPEAQRVWAEAKAVEHEKLTGMVWEIAQGSPAEYDADGNQTRSEIPHQVRLRALELLVKCRHGWREQGDANGATATAGVQIIMPAQVSLDQLQSLMPPGLTVPHAPLTSR